MQSPLAQVSPLASRAAGAAGSGAVVDPCGGRGQPHPDELRAAAQRVGFAVQHMMRHLNEPVRVSTLAAMTGLSPSHFFSLFKSATGFTPIAFFIGLRMQRACELFQNTQATIKEAAELVGYSDRYYFSRLFKQVIGVPPGEYRRTFLGSSPDDIARENWRILPLELAFSTLQDLGIVTAAERQDVPVVRSDKFDTLALTPG
jgi:AraC-like DNA-binding protein